MYDGFTRLLRFPNVALEDSACLDKLLHVRRHTCPDQGDLSDFALCLKSTARTDGAETAEREDPLQIGMRKHHIDGGIVAVVYAFRDPETISDKLHFGIVLFLVGNRGISPQIVERHSKRAHVDNIFAFLSHRFRKALHVEFAELFVVDHFDIPQGSFLPGRLVSNDLDAGFLGAIENRLERFGIIGYYRDHLHFFSDQILHRAHLLGGISTRRTDHISVKTIFLSSLLDTFFHSIEPRNAADFDHDRDLLIRGANLAIKGRTENNERSYCCAINCDTHFSRGFFVFESSVKSFT